VALQIDAGAPFEAHVTPHACSALHLEAGTPVWLVIKTHSCHPVALDRLATTAS
jgi:ABC-type molybdate transport system ATPase subunit